MANIAKLFPIPADRTRRVVASLLILFATEFIGIAHAATTEAPAADTNAATTNLGVGAWIWTTNFADKQTCRLWRSFNIPGHTLPARGTLRITADNGYRVFLDGREIGRGGDWKYLTEYDITWLISPGQHVLAIEAFNDILEAGVLLGLHVDLMNGDVLDLESDSSWYVVPSDEWGWQSRTHPRASWIPAKIVGTLTSQPWSQRKLSIIVAPPLPRIVLRFWQSNWFLASLLAVCAVIAIICVRQATQLAVHSRTERLLERERARIARDIHDDLGAGLTQLTLVGELVLREVSHDGETHAQVDSLCNKARSLLGSMDEIIWTVNPKRDTVSDCAVFICQHAQEYLSSTSIRCRLDLAEDLPTIPLDLPARRNLLLAVKEAVRNAARHSNATEVLLQIRLDQQRLEVVVEDDGRGFSPEEIPGGRNGLANMMQRLVDIGGACDIATMPGAGCRVTFTLPLTRHRGWFPGLAGSKWRENGHTHDA